MLATRASQSYATAQAQRTAIERAMQKLLYDRTMASQAAVITSLTEEMARQQTRELLVCYCVLASAMSCVTPDELDTRCEAMLANQFGLKVDFTCEEALPTLLEWGLAVRDPAAVGGAVSAVPVAEALAKVDAKWDSLYDFSGPAATSILSKKPGKVFGNVLAAAKGGMSKKERSDAAPAPEGEVMHGKAAVPPAAASSTVAASSVEGKKKKSFFSRLRS